MGATAVITIEYTPAGPAIPDHQVMTTVEQALATGMPIWTSTFQVINAARVLIAEGLSPEAIRFVFRGKQVVCNKYGAILDWPEGFGDHGSEFAERTLRAAILQKRREREATSSNPVTGGKAVQYPADFIIEIKKKDDRHT